MNETVNMVQIEAVSWNRFLTRYLAIVPGLLGGRHQFIFDGKAATIELPSHDEISEDPAHQGRAEIFSWREVDGTKIPTRVWINSVDVRVQLDRKVHVPEQVLCQPPNAYDILSKEKQQQLNGLAEDYGSIAERVFDTWLRTLRWKTNNGLIGRPQVIGPQSGWTTYLIQETSMHRFWAAHQVFKVPYGQPVTPTEWNEVEQALNNGIASPVYYDLMFDADEHLRLEDFQRSVVDAAVACESYMRQKVMQHLPSSLHDSIRKYVDEANIRQVLNNFLPELLNEEQMKIVKGISSSLQQLFNARNTILHSGRKTDLTLDECQKYLDVTRKLIAIG